MSNKKEENIDEMNKKHKIANEIIEILIRNNLSVSESTVLLDSVTKRLRVQSVTNNCLFKYLFCQVWL